MLFVTRYEGFIFFSVSNEKRGEKKMPQSEFTAVYSSGDIILNNPIESCLIFLFIIVICAAIEYILDLANEVESRFFRLIFEAIQQEVMVVGILSMLLTFSSSVIVSIPERYYIIFSWARLCLFFMAFMFVVFICLVLLAVFSRNKRWEKFERLRMQVPGELFSGREEKYKLAWEKYSVAAKVHGFTVDEVPFHKYLLKCEKANLVTLTDLSWKCWLALTTLIILNALRTKLIPGHVDAENSSLPPSATTKGTNIGTFIGVCGYFPFGLFLYVHFTLQNRLRQYLTLNTLSPAQIETATKADLDDPQSFLLWQNIESTLDIIQIFVLFNEWYVAVFCLNLLYQTFQYNFGIALPILIGALIPPGLFIVILPWTITTVTMLSSLGVNLNEKLMRHGAEQYRKAKEGPTANDSKDKELHKDGHKADGAREDSEEMKEIDGGEGGSPNGGIQWKKPRPLLIDEGVLQRLAATNQKALRDKLHERALVKKGALIADEDVKASGYLSEDSPRSPKSQPLRVRMIDF